MGEEEKTLTYEDIGRDPSIVAKEALERTEDGGYRVPPIACDDGSAVVYEAVEGLGGWVLRMFVSDNGCEGEEAPKHVEPCYMTAADNELYDAVAALLSGEVSDDAPLPERKGRKRNRVKAFQSADDALGAIVEIACATDDGEDRWDERNVRERRFNEYVRFAADAYDMFGVDIAFCTQATYDEFVELFLDACDVNAVKDFPFGTIGRGKGGAGDLGASRIANAMLCVRYPFMAPRSDWTDELLWNRADTANGYDVEWANKEFAYTYLSDFPSGWQHRIALPLLEDIRSALYSPSRREWSENLARFDVLQIKEKFGELRFYCGGAKNDLPSDVIDVYTELSRSLCLSCGRAYGTRFQAHGWWHPICFACDESDSGTGWHDDDVERKRGIAEFAGASGDASQEDIDRACYGAASAYELYRFVETTSPCASDEELEGMRGEWLFKTYSKDGTETVNKAVGFLDGTPAPDGGRWRFQDVIDGMISEIRSFKADSGTLWQSADDVPWTWNYAGRQLERLGKPAPQWRRKDGDGSEEPSPHDGMVAGSKERVRGSEAGEEDE